MAVNWEALRTSRLRILRTRIAEPEAEARRDLIGYCDSLDTPAALEIVTALVNDRVPSNVIAAAGVLARRGAEQPVEILKQHMTGGWQLRQQVADELGRSGLSIAIEPLLTLARDGDNDVRRSAILGLSRFEAPEAIPVIAYALNDAEPGVQFAAVQAWGKYGRETKDKGTLTKYLSARNEGGTHLRGAYGLMRLGEQEGFKELLEICRRSGPVLQSMIAQALTDDTAGTPVQFLEGLAGSDSDVVYRPAIAALGRSRDPKALAVLLDLTKPEAGATRTAEALMALAGNTEERAQQRIQKLARVRDSDVVAGAVNAWEASATPIPREVLHTWAGESLYALRHSAARRLECVTDPDAVELLLRLAEDPWVEIRAEALFSLGATRDPRAVQALVRAIEHENWLVRKGAVLGLELGGEPSTDRILSYVAAIDDPATVRAGLRLLDKLDEPPKTRAAILARGQDDPELWLRTAQQAVEAGDRSSADSFLPSLSSPNPVIRRTAAAALGSVGGREAVGPLTAVLEDPDWEVRLTVLTSLRRIGGESMDALGAALGSQSRRIRAGVAAVLGDLRSPEAIELLKRALSDPGRLVRSSAAAALGNERRDDCIELLMGALKDSDRGVQNASATALRRIGTPDGLAAIREWTLLRRSHQ